MTTKDWIKLFQDDFVPDLMRFGLDRATSRAVAGAFARGVERYMRRVFARGFVAGALCGAAVVGIMALVRW